jgi:hypothetical protein
MAAPMQVRRGADLRSSEGETEVTAPKFRKVEPLCLWSDAIGDVHAGIEGDALWIYMEGMAWGVTEARALRDWLNKALPEEKP